MATLEESIQLGRLADRTADDLRTLREAPRRMVAVLLAYRRERDAIQRDPVLSAEGMRQRTAQAHQRASQQLSALAGEVQAAERRVRAAATEVTAPKLSTEEALLRELRAHRAWQRFKALLDSGADALQAVERAQGDPVAVQALREELPAYLEATKHPDLVAPALEALDRLERPLLSPVERRARDLLAELDRGMANLRLSFSYAEAELAGDWDQATVLVGWDRETFQVDDGAMA